MKKFRCPICETFMKKISTQSGIKWHCEQCGYESPTFQSAIKLKKVERAGRDAKGGLNEDSVLFEHPLTERMCPKLALS